MSRALAEGEGETSVSLALVAPLVLLSFGAFRQLVHTYPTHTTLKTNDFAPSSTQDHPFPRWKLIIFTFTLLLPLCLYFISLGDAPSLSAFVPLLVHSLYYLILACYVIFLLPINIVHPLWPAIASLLTQALVVVHLSFTVGVNANRGIELLSLFVALALLVSLPLKNDHATLSNGQVDSTLWQWMTVSWFHPMIEFSIKKGKLDFSDLWPLPEGLSSSNIEEEWKILQGEPGRKDEKLWKRLILLNAVDIGVSVFIGLVQVVLAYTTPYFMNRILTTLTYPNPSKSDLILYALYIFIAALFNAQIEVNLSWLLRRASIRTNSLLIGEILAKALRRKDLGSQKEGDEKTADHGKIYNLMSSDSEKVGMAIQSFLPLIKAPLEALLGIIFLYQLLGWCALVGVALMPFGSRLGRLTGNMYFKAVMEANDAFDQRMEVQDELIQSIRQIKWFGWERLFAQKVFDIREKEMQIYVKMYLINGLTIIIIGITFPAVTYLSFLSYVKFAKKELTVPIAFTALQVFAQLAKPMGVLAYGIMNFLHVFASFDRLELFFNESEVSPISSQTEELGFKEASFAYDVEKTEGFKLKDLNVVFPKGKISVVTGVSGSGKSTLLLALLGELEQISGEVLKPEASLAYVSQVPWLQHATIKDNILFGAQFDEKRYNDVIDACALKPDLALLDLGDLTEIGEKGVSLSGGQKARVSLARAVYSEATILLLDDTLSALDAHVGAHVASSFTSSLFQGRTIILVTHAVDLCLPLASFMVTMSEGRIILQENVASLKNLKHASRELEEVVEIERQLDSAHEDGEWKPSEADQGDEDETKPEKLIEDEKKAEGHVPWPVYQGYIKASGYWLWIFVVALYTISQGSRVLQQIFLKLWGEAYGPAIERETVMTLLNQAEKYTSSTIEVLRSSNHPWGLPDPKVNVNPYLLIFLGFDIWLALINFIVFMSVRLAHIEAIRSIFKETLLRVIGGTFRYFDRTPTGRILNRFSHDFGTLDSDIQTNVAQFLQNLVLYLRSLILIIVIIPWFLPVAALVLFIFYRTSQEYLSASREFRRLESISKSPIYSLFGESLSGLMTIRAFGTQSHFKDNMSKKVDTHMKAYNGMWNANRWLLARFNVLGAVSIFIATLLTIFVGASAGLAALVITSAVGLAESTYGVLTTFSSMEVNFNSVQRINELQDVPQEPLAVIEGRRPPAYWPSDRAGIEIDGLEMAYAPDLPPVLKGISVSIAPKEKVGIVGRTGSGKSSLTFALLRCVEPRSGRILIDGIDITHIGTEDLRSRITFIPQDPAVFSGTIRSNLDPFSQHPDQVCWEVLRRVHLTSLTSPNSGPGTPSGNDEDVIEGNQKGKSKRTDIKSLDEKVTSGGGNLSAGQRQLLSLARAMLRSCRIIILDEATASVDFETDAKVQETLREGFSDAITLTIAHRLETVMDYDKILVLEAGKVVEFDTPSELLKKENGVFKEMWSKRTDH